MVESIGRGPAELHGVRYNRVYMHARQRIYKRKRGWITVRTGARLRLKFAHLSRYWWKFFNAARFELWRVDARGRRTEKVRTGPKVSYCLRDLTHTRPAMRGTPYYPHYPACSTNVSLRRDVLGTSVGWADIYPPSYPEQWIDVTGLRGCFAYVHIADPENGIYESNEDNNEAQVIVRLPFRPSERRRGCKGHDRGKVHDRASTRAARASPTNPDDARAAAAGLRLGGQGGAGHFLYRARYIRRPAPRRDRLTRGAEALGAHALGLEAVLEQQPAGRLDEPVRPAHERGARGRRRRRASDASMRPVCPVQPAGGSRV